MDSSTSFPPDHNKFSSSVISIANAHLVNRVVIPWYFIQTWPVWNMNGKNQKQKPLQAKIIIEEIDSVTQHYLWGTQLEPAKNTICQWQNV